MRNEFNAYRIYYHSAPQYYWQAMVDLYNDGRYTGRIMFIKEGRDIPKNEAKSGKPILNYPARVFDEVMDILRLEKPLYITLNTSNGIGTISTSDEPVGEEEGLALREAVIG